jgi:hypothetical protein
LNVDSSSKILTVEGMGVLPVDPQSLDQLLHYLLPVEVGLVSQIVLPGEKTMDQTLD